jgi:hypothetical protein
MCTTHLYHFEPQAAVAAITVAELITAAHAADAACRTVEVALRRHIIVGNAALSAEVGSENGAASEAGVAVAEQLLGVAVAADNVLQLLSWEAVVAGL